MKKQEMFICVDFLDEKTSNSLELSSKGLVKKEGGCLFKLQQSIEGFFEKQILETCIKYAFGRKYELLHEENKKKEAPVIGFIVFF